MQTITITLDESLYERAKAKCDEQGGRSVSSLIREATAEKLDRLNLEAVTVQADAEPIEPRS